MNDKEMSLVDAATEKSNKLLAQVIMEFVTEFPAVMAILGPGDLVRHFAKAFKGGMAHTVDFMEAAHEMVSESEDAHETINTITGYHD